MEGQPAWMASITLRGPRGIINVGRYTMEQMLQAKSILNQALQGAGNPDRERLFRTNALLYLHRAASAEEQERLPSACASFPAALPIQILYTKGLPPILSTDPCERPRRGPHFPGRPDLWIPLGCNECPSCWARDDVQRRAQLRKAA
jgi:hypothetical protein